MNAAVDEWGDWDRQPTALEAAHYDSLLRQQKDRQAQSKAAEEARAKMIFGECVLRLVKLGVKEPQARSMLGKWRGQAKDDALLVRVVNAAADKSVPDPISYITKALAGALTRSSGVEAVTKGKWESVGWEKPRMTAKGPRWKNGSRGRVWRDPYGKLTVLPAEDGTVVPGLEDEPGIEIG